MHFKKNSNGVRVVVRSVDDSKCLVEIQFPVEKEDLIYLRKTTLSPVKEVFHKSIRVNIAEVLTTANRVIDKQRERDNTNVALTFDTRQSR